MSQEKAEWITCKACDGRGHFLAGINTPGVTMPEPRKWTCLDCNGLGKVRARKGDGAS